MDSSKLRRDLVKFLKSKGFSGTASQLERRSSGVVHGISLQAMRESPPDLFQMDAFLAAYSPEVYFALNGQETRWSLCPMVEVSLARLETGDYSKSWRARKDHPEDFEAMYRGIAGSLESVGLPFLDKIQTADDVVHVMLSTSYSALGSSKQQEYADAYKAKKDRGASAQ